jgi:hypothetical protein
MIEHWQCLDKKCLDKKRQDLSEIRSGKWAAGPR